MGDEVPAAVDPTAAPDAGAERRHTVVVWAMTASWLWVVALAMLTAVLAYLFLMFASFADDALGDGHETAVTYLITLGIPALMFAIATAAGLGAALSLARWTSRQAPLARVHAGLLGLTSAVAGAGVAALIYYLALEAPGVFTSR